LNADQSLDMPMMDRFSVREVAERLGCTASHIVNFGCQGIIPIFILGNEGLLMEKGTKRLRDEGGLEVPYWCPSDEPFMLTKSEALRLRREELEQFLTAQEASIEFFVGKEGSYHSDTIRVVGEKPLRRSIDELFLLAGDIAVLLSFPFPGRLDEYPAAIQQTGSHDRDSAHLVSKIMKERDGDAVSKQETPEERADARKDIYFVLGYLTFVYDKLCEPEIRRYRGRTNSSNIAGKLAGKILNKLKDGVANKFESGTIRGWLDDSLAWIGVGKKKKPRVSKNLKPGTNERYKAMIGGLAVLLAECEGFQNMQDRVELVELLLAEHQARHKAAADTTLPPRTPSKDWIGKILEEGENQWQQLLSRKWPR